ncbi:MAG TPA: hypothetical protein VIY48_17440 [Candidatus Paceibacterota bacterium]
MANSTYENLVANTAHILYNEYGSSAEWKNFQGNPMPMWEELPIPTREHWIEVARKAINMFIPEYAIRALKDQ